MRIKGDNSNDYNVLISMIFELEFDRDNSSSSIMFQLYFCDTCQYNVAKNACQLIM